MKKFLSIILSMVLLSLVFCCSANAKSYSKYNKYIKAAVSSSNSCGRESKGFLYDFDKNGTKELVMIYWKQSSQYGQIKVVSVYTLKGKKVKAIIKNKKLVTDTTGGGDAGVAVKGGKRYLLVNTGSGDDSTYNTVKLYKISSSKAKCKKTGKCSIYYDYNKRKAVTSSYISGKKTSYSKYVKWEKSFSLKYLKLKKSRFDNLYKYYYTSTAKSLSSLI